MKCFKDGLLESGMTDFYDYEVASELLSRKEIEEAGWFLFDEKERGYSSFEELMANFERCDALKTLAWSDDEDFFLFRK